MPLQISGFDWGYMYIGISLATYETQLKDTYRVIFFVSVLCLIIAALLSYFFARQITQPIRLLRQTTHRIMEGDLTARADIPQDHEVGDLAASFNSMTDRLIASQQKIQDAYDELEVYRKNLEGLVRQRTEELTAANLKLLQELAERERAETALGESERRYNDVPARPMTPESLAGKVREVLETGEPLKSIV